MPIEFVSELAEFQLYREEFYKNWISRIIQSKHKRLGEVNYWFVSEDQILQINKEYLKHNYLTDIISFDNSFLNEVNGDIYICPNVVRINAINHAEGNYELELARVIIHGILHFCGFSDKSADQQRLMRTEEDLALYEGGFASG